MPRRSNPLRWLFPIAFSFACVLFWWLPSILMAYFHIQNPLDMWTLWVSIASLVLFLIGYFFYFKNEIRVTLFSQHIQASCVEFAYRASLVIALPAVLVGAQFAAYRAGVPYGEGSDIPLFTQAILYTHMFFAYMFVGGVPDLERKNRRRVFIVCGLVLLPRILITLHWGRFFAGQTIAVLLFIALARGWLKMTAKQWLFIIGVALLILLGPVVTRTNPYNDALQNINQGTAPAIVAFFQQGSTLHFFQEYRDSLPSDCPPLLVSMTQKTIPWSMLGMCTIQVGDVKNLPATLDRLLTRQDSNNLATGTGSIYIFELYLSGGLFAVIVGSALFGLCCRWWVENTGKQSILAGVWAESLVRSLMAPRGTLGYEFERIPSLLLATALVALLCWAGNVLRTKPAVSSSH